MKIEKGLTFMQFLDSGSHKFDKCAGYYSILKTLLKENYFINRNYKPPKFEEWNANFNPEDEEEQIWSYNCNLWERKQSLIIFEDWGPLNQSTIKLKDRAITISFEKSSIILNIYGQLKQIETIGDLFDATFGELKINLEI